MRIWSLPAVCLFVVGLSAQGTETVPDPGARPKPADAAPPEPQGGPEEPKDLKFETGKVTVPGLATIDLPAGWRYLQARDARKVLEQMWGNPPDRDTLGLAFPAGGGPVAEGGFAVVVSFDDSGYVEDGDAAGLDYAQMLKDMQAGSKAANDERRKQGYPTVELLGWAEQPHYDATEKKLYWAKKLRFEGEQSPTLNYDVRILGRRGSLVLTAVADASALTEVAAGCKQLLRATQFQSGQRYADYSPGVDKVAAYGIGGLIAGKLLLKGGFLKLLAALWKPLAVGVVVLVGLIGKLLGRRKPAVARAGVSRRRAAGRRGADDGDDA
ncbi:MAG: DUF2167 domain-containing protein [Planctomycetes bacterium]|nr:DUF2167 domain-containing protein [Planctomycetota bacterium]